MEQGTCRVRPVHVTVSSHMACIPTVMTGGLWRLLGPLLATQVPHAAAGVTAHQGQVRAQVGL